MYSIGLTVLLLGVMVTTYGVWTQSSFSHADPSFDQGCYCHNNGIAVWVNDSGDGNGGLYLGSFTAGSSFHLLVSTNNAQATGVVPGLQEWESNQTDNAKFTISPTEVTTTSSANLNKTAGSITALYKVTVPATAGTYVLTLYAQGTELQPLALQVSGGTTSSTTSTTTTTTKSSSSSSATSTSTSATSASTSASTSATPTVGITFTSPTLGESLFGNETYTISGTIYPIPALPDNVSITVQLLGSSTVLDSSIQPVTPSGNFSYTTHVGGSHPWTLGPYLITATDSNGLKATTTFEYGTSATTTTTASTAMSTTTQTVTTTTPTTVTQTTTTTTTLPVTTTTTSATTKTVTGPGTTSTVTTTQTVTGPASTTTSTVTTTAPPTTVTSTAPPSTRTSTQTTTQTAISTVTQTTSTTPGWAYGAMVLLLLIGLAIGYIVKRPSVKQT
jgi:hypothetical protein